MRKTQFSPGPRVPRKGVFWIALFTAALLFAGCSREPAGPSPETAAQLPLPGNEALREAFRRYDTLGKEISAAREPERYIVTFEHLVEDFPPVPVLKELPPVRRKEASCILNGYGLAIQQKGRVEEAETWFRKALDVQPGLLAAWFNLAVALSEMGRFHAAGKIFESLLHEDLSPEYRKMTKDWIERIRILQSRSGR